MHVRRTRIALTLLAMVVMGAAAERTQALAAPEPAATEPATAGVAGADESLLGVKQDESEAPDSVEQGQTQMADSFDRRPIQSLLSESRFVGLRDTTFSVQLRSF